MRLPKRWVRGGAGGTGRAAALARRPRSDDGLPTHARNSSRTEERQWRGSLRLLSKRVNVAVVTRETARRSKGCEQSPSGADRRVARSHHHGSASTMTAEAASEERLNSRSLSDCGHTGPAVPGCGCLRRVEGSSRSVDLHRWVSGQARCPGVLPHGLAAPSQRVLRVCRRAGSSDGTLAMVQSEPEPPPGRCTAAPASSAISAPAAQSCSPSPAWM